MRVDELPAATSVLDTDYLLLQRNTSSFKVPVVNVNTNTNQIIRSRLGDYLTTWTGSYSPIGSAFLTMQDHIGIIEVKFNAKITSIVGEYNPICFTVDNIKSAFGIVGQKYNDLKAPGRRLGMAYVYRNGLLLSTQKYFPLTIGGTSGTWYFGYEDGGTYPENLLMTDLQVDDIIIGSFYGTY